MSEKKIATADIARILHEKSNITLEQAKKFVNSYFSLVAEELATEDSASIYKFGTFKKQLKARRTSRNPRTGEVILVPAKYAVTFTPVHAVAEKINEPFANLQAVEIDEEDGEKNDNEKQIIDINNFSDKQQDKAKDEASSKNSGTQIEQAEMVKLWGIGKTEETLKPEQPQKKIEVVAPKLQDIKVISKQTAKKEAATPAKTNDLTDTSKADKQNNIENKENSFQTNAQNDMNKKHVEAKKINGTGQYLQQPKSNHIKLPKTNQVTESHKSPKFKEVIIERQIIKEQIIEQQVRREIKPTAHRKHCEPVVTGQTVRQTKNDTLGATTTVRKAVPQNNFAGTRTVPRRRDTAITGAEYKMLFAPPTHERQKDTIAKDLKTIARCWFGAGVAVVFTAIVLGVLVYSLVTAKQNYQEQQISVETEKEQQLTDLAQMRTAIPNAYASIAEFSYGDARLWPYIYSANRLKYFDPDYDVGKKNFVLPRNPDKTLDASIIEHSAIDAYNVYKIIYNEKPSAKNREKYLRAVKVIAETEEVMPGFLSRYELSFATDDILLAKRYLGD